MTAEKKKNRLIGEDTEMTHEKTKTITGVAILMAIVIVLQLLGSFIRFGPFSISLVLIPIVVGAALYGPFAGGLLGLTFGAVVLLSGDAAPFLAVNVFGTILTVLLKGALAGVFAGLVFRMFKKNETLGTVLSAAVCPITNTGIFLLGCLLFFLPTISQWAAGLGFESVGKYMIFGLVGGNFLAELLTNIILSPIILCIIRIGKNK